MANHTPRGYNILEKCIQSNIGILLASRNGAQFIVSIHFYFWGMQVSKKTYTFANHGEAHFFYKQSLKKLLGLPDDSRV